MFIFIQSSCAFSPVNPSKLSWTFLSFRGEIFSPTNNYAFVHHSTSAENLPIITLNGKQKYLQLPQAWVLIWLSFIWLLGVPLAPGKPAVQLSTRARPDENSVTDEINITWNIPKDDGGFPITGYRIEMLDIQTNNWIEITFVEVMFSCLRVQNIPKIPFI